MFGSLDKTPELCSISLTISLFLCFVLPLKRFAGMEDLSESDKATILSNISDARLLSDIIKKGFGPLGRKISTNLLRDILVADSTCNIFAGVDVQNPSAQILLLMGKEQQDTSGDGVILTIALAGELLKKAGKLMKKDNVHPYHIIKGYKRALEMACQNAKEWALMGDDIFDAKNKSHVTFRIDSVISSQLFQPVEGLSSVIAQACIEAWPKVLYFLVDGGLDSGIPDHGILIRGMLLHATIGGTINSVANGKVAVFSCGIDTFEQAKVEEFITTVAGCGANVIVSDTDLGGQALLCCNIHKLMFLKVRSKSIIRHLCRTTGATAMSKPRLPSTEEFGYVDSISMEEVGGSNVVIVKNETTCDPTSTIVLPLFRGRNLDDLRRAIMAGVNSYKAMCMNGEIILGAGATEFVLSKRLWEASYEVTGDEQLAFRKFAKSLEMVPKSLAKNGGYEGHLIVDTLNKRYEAHSETNLGVDLKNGTCKDVSDINIWDLLNTKLNALKNACEAATAVLVMYLA